jgi:protein-L-isoaspartate(D-aspartate) O-methyltransferase
MATREIMLEDHLVARGIKHPLVLNAFATVDREAFVPPSQREDAWADKALRIGEGQTISQPYMVALMLDAAALEASHRVLEIGTGSGYQTALLACICREVYTVERLEPLATAAEDLLDSLGYTNVRYALADGSLGWDAHAPYDRIVVSCACPRIPKALTKQVVEGGRIVAPIGKKETQELVVAVKRGEDLEEQRLGGCRFVPLVGKGGFR